VCQVSVLAYTSHIFFFQSAYSFDQLTVFDLRSRVDVFVFSLLLIVIVRLKLAIHSLRKSDIALLHKARPPNALDLLLQPPAPSLAHRRSARAHAVRPDGCAQEYYTSCIALADQQHHHQPIKVRPAPRAPRPALR
jgi:hypothetical protein